MYRSPYLIPTDAEDNETTPHCSQRWRTCEDANTRTSGTSRGLFSVVVSAFENDSVTVKDAVIR